MKKNKTNFKFNYPNIVSIILCLTILVLPWICYKVQINASTEEKKVLPVSVTGVVDYFLVGKGMFMVLVVLLILGIFIFGIIHKKRDFHLLVRINDLGYTKIFTLISLYSTLLIISTLCSKYKMTSIFGNMNSCEGAIILFCYIIIFTASSLSFTKETSIMLFKITITLIALITILLTFVDFFYRPIAQIIFPTGFSTDFINMVSLTFYNPGYFGGFCILIFPVMSSYFLKEEENYKIILYGFVSVFLAFSTITSKSTAAFYILIFEIIAILSLLFFQKQCKRKLKIFTLLIFVLCVIVLNIVSGGKLFNLVKSNALNSTTAIKSDSTYILNDIILDGDKVTLQGKDSKITAQIVNSPANANPVIKFYDSNDKLLDPDIIENKIYFHDGYDAICMYIENNALTIDLGYKDPIRFYMYNNMFYPMISDKTIIKNIQGNNLGLDKYYSIVTGRGYFWVNSIPILKNTILIGHGAGTFELYFKQYDFVGLLNSQGTTDLIIDKPHSFYLQNATQTGILSMLCIIGLFILVIANSVKALLIYKKESKYSLHLTTLLGLLIGNLSYIIFLTTNDSSLGVSPVFWILLGINACIAVNKESGLFVG